MPMLWTFLNATAKCKVMEKVMESEELKRVQTLQSERRGYALASLMSVQIAMGHVILRVTGINGQNPVMVS